MRGYRTEKESTFTSFLILNNNVLTNYFHYLAVNLDGKSQIFTKNSFLRQLSKIFIVFSNTDAARCDHIKFIADKVCTCYTCLVSTYPALLQPGSHVGRARKIRLQTRNAAQKFAAMLRKRRFLKF